MSSDSSSPADQIPDKTWEVPFQEGTPLHDLFEDILREKRDIVMILDDYYARRGTGKTVSSLRLADAMDQTEEGMTWSKCSLQPEEIRNAYAREEPRSGLVLDEGEVGASNREAMTNSNQALREIMSMGRVEQKYCVINAPTKGFIDKDLLKLADVWVSMMRKGQALVHFLEWEPYSEQLLTPAKQWLEFEDIPTNTQLRDVYNKLTKAKQKRIEGGEGNSFYTVKEHKEILKRQKKQVRQETRNQIIQSICNSPAFAASDMGQGDIGDAVDLSRARINQIANGNV